MDGLHFCSPSIFVYHIYITTQVCVTLNSEAQTCVVYKAVWGAAYCITMRVVD